MPRREPGRLRRAPVGVGDHRLPDDALPVGPPRGEWLPRRGHRCRPDAQRRARRLPVGPDHPGPIAVRRRRRLPPHRRRRVGARRSRRGTPGVPRPDRTSDPLGLRRQPPHQPSERHATPSRVLRRLARAGRRVRAAPAPRRGGGRTHRRVSLPPPGRRGGGRRPRPLPLRARRGPARPSSASCSSSRRGSPRSDSNRHAIPRSCGQSTSGGPIGSTTSTCSPTTADSGPCSDAPVSCSSATATCGRCSAPGEATGAKPRRTRYPDRSLVSLEPSRRVAMPAGPNTQRRRWRYWG